MDWNQFDNGNTIGTRGSEEGIIIMDIETPDGARVTLEKNTSIAPFAVTFGIYGLMFHTGLFKNENDAIEYVEKIKTKIASVFNHYSVREENRGVDWNDKLDQLLNELVR